MIWFIVGGFFLLLVPYILFLRSARGRALLAPADPRKKRRNYLIFGLMTAGLVAMPLASVLAWIWIEEAVWYDRVEAQVTGTERVCVIETSSRRRRGTRRDHDRTEAMPCLEANARLSEFGDNARADPRERIDFRYSDPATGAARDGYVIYDSPRSPFQRGARISVLVPDGWEGPSRRPEAL